MTSRRGRSSAKTVGEIVRERLREVRRARKMNAARVVELYGDPAMTETVLLNMEADRRQTPTTVDELVRLAYVLDVPAEALLVAAGTAVQIAPDVVVDSGRFLRWLRGQEALDGTNTDHYRAVAAEVLDSSARTVPAELREEFLARAQAAFDGFFADSEEIHRKTRQQVSEVLGEVRAAVVSGERPEDVLAVIDGFLDRLQ